ncbi:MAG TPA: rhomboid family intramembrane serine protease [Thermoanaerobaculia bacterium]|nr:rhomboid family intramembrane serine protease [Thermoanaerobaculia bacterium]
MRGAVLGSFIGTLWIVRALDTFLARGVSAAGMGIVPRTIDGLWAIPVTPLIHANWQHLISNTIPLVILGGLVLLRGVTEFIFVTVFSILISGLGTWLFGAGNAQHVGASGLVFGLFGYLVFRSAFDRKLGSAVITLIVAAAYGTAMVYSLIPTPDVSWSGHFFGFLGGFLAARIRYPHRQALVAP